jgi:hypothetical protein
MPQTNFYGRISSGDPTVVRALLQAWLCADGISEKLKLSGEQFVCETEAVYVYSHAVDGMAHFLLEGHRGAGVDETRAWLQQLSDACTARGVPATLEYVAVDQAGREISDQYTLSAGK